MNVHFYIVALFVHFTYKFTFKNRNRKYFLSKFCLDYCVRVYLGFPEKLTEIDMLLLLEFNQFISRLISREYCQQALQWVQVSCLFFPMENFQTFFHILNLTHKRITGINETSSIFKSNPYKCFICLASQLWIYGRELSWAVIIWVSLQYKMNERQFQCY